MLVRYETACSGKTSNSKPIHSVHTIRTKKCQEREDTQNRLQNWALPGASHLLSRWDLCLENCGGSKCNIPGSMIQFNSPSPPALPVGNIGLQSTANGQRVAGKAKEEKPVSEGKEGYVHTWRQADGRPLDILPNAWKEKMAWYFGNYFRLGFVWRHLGVCHGIVPGENQHGQSLA